MKTRDQVISTALEITKELPQVQEDWKINIYGHIFRYLVNETEKREKKRNEE